MWLFLTQQALSMVLVAQRDGFVRNVIEKIDLMRALVLVGTTRVRNGGYGSPCGKRSN